jgi:hypothetical protein
LEVQKKDEVDAWFKAGGAAAPAEKTRRVNAKGYANQTYTKRKEW